MRLTKSLLCGISVLALATGTAFANVANEELSLTEPSTGQELIGSYEVTSEGDVISSEQFSEPMNDRDVLSYSDESSSMSEPMSDRDMLAYLGEFDENAAAPESGSVALSEPDLIDDTELSLG